MRLSLILITSLMLSSCSSMSSLEDVKSAEPTETELVDRSITEVYRDLELATKFCFANNSATNYNVVSSLSGSKGKVMVVTGAELGSSNVWLVASIQKEGKSTRVNHTSGNSLWKRHITKMKGWARGKTDC